MKRFGLLILLVAGLSAVAGCSKPATSAPTPKAETTPEEEKLPTHAQAKLQTLKLYIGPEVLDAELALTYDQIRTGMMFRTNIQETDAMLFVFTAPFRVSFWMTNCPESLSAAYIDPDGIIREIHHLEKMDPTSVDAATNNIQYVLEVKDGWFTRHHITTNTLIRTERGSLAQTFMRQQ